MWGREKASSFFPISPQGHNEKKRSLDFIRKRIFRPEENLLAARKPKDRGRETDCPTVTLTQVSRNHRLIVLLAQESRCARIPFLSPGLPVNSLRASGEDARQRESDMRSSQAKLPAHIAHWSRSPSDFPSWLSKERTLHQRDLSRDPSGSQSSSPCQRAVTGGARKEIPEKVGAAPGKREKASWLFQEGAETSLSLEITFELSIKHTEHGTWKAAGREKHRPGLMTVLEAGDTLLGPVSLLTPVCSGTS